jgi:hypothetical protein
MWNGGVWMKCVRNVLKISVEKSKICNFVAMSVGKQAGPGISSLNQTAREREKKGQTTALASSSTLEQEA